MINRLTVLLVRRWDILHDTWAIIELALGKNHLRTQCSLLCVIEWVHYRDPDSIALWISLWEDYSWFVVAQRFFLQLTRCKVSSENNNAEIRIFSDAGPIIVQLNFRNNVTHYVQCSGSCSATDVTCTRERWIHSCYIEFSRLNLMSISIWYRVTIWYRLASRIFVSRRKFVTRTLFSSRKIYFRQWCSSSSPRAVRVCLSTCL